MSESKQPVGTRELVLVTCKVCKNKAQFSKKGNCLVCKAKSPEKYGK